MRYSINELFSYFKGGVLMNQPNKIKEEEDSFELRYRALFEQNTDAIFLSNMEGVVLDVNQKTVVLLGYERKEMIGTWVGQYVTDYNREESLEREMRLKKGEKVGFYYRTLIRKDKTTFPGEISPSIVRNSEGEPVYFQLLVRDISELHKSEKELKEQEFRYQALFEYGNDAIFLASHTGKILGANQKAVDLLGYKIKELVGMTTDTIVHDFDYEDSTQKLDSLMRGKSVPIFQRILRKKDNTLIPVEVNAMLVKDSEGTPLFVQTIVRDVSERIKAEEELKRAYTELERFASIISHDLKAPLRGIKNIAEILLNDHNTQLDAKGQEYLDLLRQRVKKMHALIEGVLQYSKISHKKKLIVEIDLKEVLDEVIDLLAPPVHIKISYDTELPTLNGDKTHFIQIFQNLVSNAIKFMDKDQGIIVIGCMDQGNLWEFYVADNGLGIPEHHFKGIFQMFSALNSENTGIGLAIVNKIVKSYDGEIWVESIVGEGSTFRFTIKK